LDTRRNLSVSQSMDGWIVHAHPQITRIFDPAISRFALYTYATRCARVESMVRGEEKGRGWAIAPCRDRIGHPPWSQHLRFESGKCWGGCCAWLVYGPERVLLSTVCDNAVAQSKIIPTGQTPSSESSVRSASNGDPAARRVVCQMIRRTDLVLPMS
jgi:hypothetical protein